MNLNERITEIPQQKEKKISPGCKALFLDRDGVIIKDVGYISDVKDVSLEKGIQKLLKFTYDLQIPVFVVTNQSGISRGFYTWKEFDEVNNRMLYMIGDKSPIIAIFANGHLTNLNNNWRKPNPGMINAVSQKYNISIKDSFLIGDRLSDMIAGCRSGVKTLIHVKTGHGQNEYEKILNLCNDVNFIFDEMKSKIIFIENLLEFPYKILKG